MSGEPHGEQVLPSSVEEPQRDYELIGRSPSETSSSPPRKDWRPVSLCSLMGTLRKGVQDGNFPPHFNFDLQPHSLCLSVRHWRDLGSYD